MKGLTTPLSHWVQAICLFVQVFGDLCVVSYWIDTLVLKLREILISTLLHHPSLFKGKTNASSRSSTSSECAAPSSDLLESSASKRSKAAPLAIKKVSAWQVMTHKYRGSIVVLSISKSVEPNEERKKMTSGFQ